MKEAEKALWRALRNFFKGDNHCALDVGRMNEGIRSFEVRRPKLGEGYPEVSIREGPINVGVTGDQLFVNHATCSVLSCFAVSDCHSFLFRISHVYDTLF